MPSAWGLAQYKPRPGKPTARYCAIDDHQAAIRGDTSVRPQGGDYAYREVLGGQAVIKVTGVSNATLQSLAQDPVIRPFPGVQHLNDSLGVLTDVQWGNYRTFAISLGYPAAEWDARFGGAGQQGNYVLRDVILFLMRRRFEPRWDAPSQSIILDGAQVPQEDPDELDQAVQID